MKKATALAAILIAAVFAVWVWPTPYRYDKLLMGEREVPIRSHRFKDTVEYMTPAGEWRLMGRRPPVDGLDSDVKKALEGKPVSTMDPDVERALKSSPNP